MPSINVSKTGLRQLLRSSKKRDAKEQLKQSTVTYYNERKEATTKCQATQTDMFEDDKDEDYDYAYS